MQIIEPGTEVDCGPFKAEVLCVSITVRGIQYEIGYWFKDEWKQVWLPESQVTKYNEPNRTLGFK